jgi:hypothetical protein
VGAWCVELRAEVEGADVRVVGALSIAALFGVAACTTVAGGAGSSPGGGVGYVPTTCAVQADIALKIVNAGSHMEGVAAEYDWLSRNLPGWSRDSQAQLSIPGGRDYDVLYLVKGKEKKTVCFDISDFY